MGPALLPLGEEFNFESAVKKANGGKAERQIGQIICVFGQRVSRNHSSFIVELTKTSGFSNCPATDDISYKDKAIQSSPGVIQETITWGQSCDC